jgi:hypothetical protein
MHTLVINSLDGGFYMEELFGDASKTCITGVVCSMWLLFGRRLAVAY